MRLSIRCSEVFGAVYFISGGAGRRPNCGINDAAFERVCEIECGDGEGTLALHDDGLIREFFAGGNIDGGDVITNE